MAGFALGPIVITHFHRPMAAFDETLMNLLEKAENGEEPISMDSQDAPGFSQPGHVQSEAVQELPQEDNLTALHQDTGTAPNAAAEHENDPQVRLGEGSIVKMAGLPTVTMTEHDRKELGKTGEAARDSDKKPIATSDIAGKLPSTTKQRFRTSLEELQRWTVPQLEQHQAPSRESQVSLPISSSSKGTLEYPETRHVPLGQSLDQLVLRPQDVPLPPDDGVILGLETSEVPGEDIEPINVSKPKKKVMKTRRRTKNTMVQSSQNHRHPIPAVAPEVEEYRTNIIRLAANFPQFDNVAADITRHQWSTRVVVHDRLESDQPMANHASRMEYWDGRSTAPSYEEFSTTLRTVSDTCIQRAILIEDLTPSLIDLLGATFQIPPHVFEVHLLGSGYKAAQNKALAWHARSSAQGYSSITWYRPVLPLLPLTAAFRNRLIADRKPSVRCVFDGCERKKDHDIRLETTANIWRGNLELSPESGDYYKGSKDEYPVGWEERATIWTRDINGCRFVILLLDPVPVAAIQESLSLIRQRQRRPPILVTLLPKPEVRFSKQKPHSNPPAASRHAIVREWMADTSYPAPMSGRKGSSFPPPPPPPPVPRGFTPSGLGTDSLPPPPPPPPPLPPGFATTFTAHYLPPAGMEAVPEMNDQPKTTGSISQAPDPDITPAGLRRRATRPDISKNVSNKTQRLPDRTDADEKQLPRVGVSNTLPPGAGPSNVPETNTMMPLPKQELEEETLTNENHGPFVPYVPIKARTSSSATVGGTFTTRNVRAYIKSLQISSSTLDEFDYFLQLPSKGKERSHDPLRALFRVIHDDTDTLVEIIRLSAQRIREDMMDEDLMQKSVSFWRSLLNRLNFTLGEFDQRLSTFMHFVDDPETRLNTHDSRAELQSMTLARDTRHMLKTCMELLDRSAHSLLAEMQVVDSRRSIAEAESVSKLTELAFIFIPLSFVASLFSMQINELGDGVPLYLFVIVAIVFVVVAYAVRLSIRSSRLVQYRDSLVLRIRDESNIQYNQTIPTHLALAWGGKTLGKMGWTALKNFVFVFAPASLALAIVAAILSPIVLLWLRGMSRGFIAIITVILIILDLILIYPVIIIKYSPKAILRLIYVYNKVNWNKHKEARRRRKERSRVDPEAIDEESGIEKNTVSSKK